MENLIYANIALKQKAYRMKTVCFTHLNSSLSPRDLGASFGVALRCLYAVLGVCTYGWM